MGIQDTSVLIEQQGDLPLLWGDHVEDRQRGDLERKRMPAKSNDVNTNEAHITFDSLRYHYRGLSFTIDEAGAPPGCPLERIQAMVDATLSDPMRVRELSRFGKRFWHSRVRPESAACQALDYALGHNVSLVARYLPYIRHLFDDDPSRADTWTVALQRAYSRRKTDREPVCRLLEEAGVPFKK